MKTKIIKEKNNPHMKRREIEMEIEHLGGATPPAAVLQQFLAKELGNNPEKIDIKSIFSVRGRALSNAKIHLWESDKVKDLSKTEEKPAEVTEVA